MDTKLVTALQILAEDLVQCCYEQDSDRSEAAFRSKKSLPLNATSAYTDPLCRPARVCVAGWVWLYIFLLEISYSHARTPSAWSCLPVGQRDQSLNTQVFTTVFFIQPWPRLLISPLGTQLLTSSMDFEYLVSNTGWHFPGHNIWHLLLVIRQDCFCRTGEVVSHMLLISEPQRTEKCSQMGGSNSFSVCLCRCISQNMLALVVLDN